MNLFSGNCLSCNESVFSIDEVLNVNQEQKHLCFRRGCFLKGQTFNDVQHKAAYLLTSILLYEVKNNFSGKDNEFIINNSSFVKLLQKTLYKNNISCNFIDEDVNNNSYAICYIENFDDKNAFFTKILFSETLLLGFLFSDESFITI